MMCLSNTKHYFQDSFVSHYIFKYQFDIILEISLIHLMNLNNEIKITVCGLLSLCSGRPCA